MLNWFSFKTNVTKYEDSFARSLPAKLLGIKSAIKKAVGDESQNVILVAHFIETFLQLQDMLDNQDISYEVGTDKLNLQWFETLRDSGCDVTLTLAEMLDPLPVPDESKISEAVRVSVMIAEKHPLAASDQHVQNFCESLPCRVKWGYFLSFEDALLQKLVDDRALKILDMFGMGQNELINSKMVSNLLKHSLKKMESSCTSNHPADSASQWIELNMG